MRAVLAFIFLALACFGQGALEPAKLAQQLTDSWPTYNGDYSGRRYSALQKINASNIHSLTLAWVFLCNRSELDASD
jgi:glucose dehydrogenase